MDIGFVDTANVFAISDVFFSGSRACFKVSPSPRPNMLVNTKIRTSALNKVLSISVMVVSPYRIG